MDLPVSRRVAAAFTEAEGLKPVLLPILGGSLPTRVFEDNLGVPIVGVSIVNHDNNQHGADENLRLGNLWKGIKTFAALIMMAGGR